MRALVAAALGVVFVTGVAHADDASWSAARASIRQYSVLFDAGRFHHAAAVCDFALDPLVQEYIDALYDGMEGNDAVAWGDGGVLFNARVDLLGLGEVCAEVQAELALLPASVAPALRRHT